MKCYTDDNVVGVTIQLRKDGNAERGRGVGRKSWLLKNVMITLATDPPTPALGRAFFSSHEMGARTVSERVVGSWSRFQCGTARTVLYATSKKRRPGARRADGHRCTQIEFRGSQVARRKFQGWMVVHVPQIPK